MRTTAKKTAAITFSPNLRGSDPCANYWMRQVTLRLRREVCWCWRERGGDPGASDAALPPFAGKASIVLDMTRFWAEKQNFCLSDPTARYLTDQITSSVRPATRNATRGSFGWVVEELQLDDLAQFVLALALVVAFDGSMGSVIATCLNDHAKTAPNLALAQRLWDEPDRLLEIADPLHPLFRHGLISSNLHQNQVYAATVWETQIATPPLVARQLLLPNSSLPAGLIAVNEEPVDEQLTELARMTSLRLRVDQKDGLRLFPIIAPEGSARRMMVAAISRLNHREVLEFRTDPSVVQDSQYLTSLATVCWLRGNYLFFSQELPPSLGAKPRADRDDLPSATVPANVFLAASDHSQLAQLPRRLLEPAVEIAPATYEERLKFWKDGLGRRAKGLAATVAECARRFRFERTTIGRICEELKALPGAVNADNLVAACRAEMDADIGAFATRVTPRFQHEELILPHKQHLQFQEIVKAMQSLTEVHFEWGTSKVWNEAGISVLFGGPPGTGKTMAAEILALKLGLPMYRIDLSQVVNKYIGETEKNLKRVFDATDQSDIILFFDEADSLFGRRTEVSDAHDRYANLEISYLLERMERFRGLAILATNRKKDLDEAFLRRLRYIVDFPLPEVTERKKIWRQVIPKNADSSELDFDFLAERFSLSGGNIRSVVLNACLQCAANKHEQPRVLRMNEVVVALQREYEKINRTLSLQQYGTYAQLVKGLELE